MFRRLYWFWKTSRLGPDILSTHFLLFFKTTARWICRKKFRHFGEDSEFRPYAYAVETQNISIGSNVVIRPGTSLYSNESPEGTIVIEDDVAIGAGVHVYADNHIFKDITRPIVEQGHEVRPVTIQKGAWIGAGAIILCGVTVGRNAVVGAGAVVTRDVPAFSVVVGSPAKVVKELA